MVNYQLEEASYQIVSGINIRLTYKGLDQYSTIVVVVNVSLLKIIRILSFSAFCANTYEYCDSQMVHEYFFAVEGMIIKHP